MLEIQLQQTGKRYNREWIFKAITYTFKSGCSYAITGANGSGKSTLLQTILGATLPSSGSINYSVEGVNIESEKAHEFMVITAPYLDIIEEMTAIEFLQFHQAFKPLIDSLSVTEILQIVGLESAATKQIRYYSSGMKQRIKLAQAIFSNVPVLLLDEPCTNLDLKGFELYKNLISQYCKNKLVIVCSNDKEEYNFCSEILDIHQYK